MSLRHKTIKAAPAPPPRLQRPRHTKREVAGGATADCAALCCCMPCAVMDIVVLAAYKVPVGLVKKAIGKKEQRRRKKLAMKSPGDALHLQRNPPQMQVQTAKERGQNGVIMERKVGQMLLEEHLAKDAAEDPETVTMEDEMWAQFNGTGFWRSTSQRFNEHQLLKNSDGMDRV